MSPAYAGIFSWLFGDPVPDAGLSYEAQIKFNTDSSKIAPNSKKILDKIGEKLISIEESLSKSDINMHLLIEAHTDNVAPTRCNYIKKKSRKKICSEIYNEALSLNRAAAVGNYLKHNFGFKPSDMNIVGVGFKDPKIKGKAAYTKAGRKQNRRVRIVVTKAVIKEFSM